MWSGSWVSHRTDPAGDRPRRSEEGCVDTMSANRNVDGPEDRAPSGACVVIASNAADAAAVRAVESHHAQLAGALSAHVEALLDAVGSVAGSGASGIERARVRLTGFCIGQLLPHAAANCAWW